MTLLAQAARIGAHIGSLCATIHRRDGEHGVRRILGVLGLVKKHGALVVDAACAAALACEDAALNLLSSLVVSGQIKLRRMDGWRRIAAVLSQRTRVAA